MKYCKYCETDKPLNNFKVGRNKCKECQKLDWKQYYSENCDHLKQKRRINYHSDPEKHKLEMKVSYEKHKEKRLKSVQEYYEHHKKEIDEYRTNYWKRPENKKRRSETKKLRRLNDPSFRILCNIRSRIANALRSGTKPSSTKKALGCTTTQLTQYLESKFQPGMSWDNYGDWHIDHIIPLSSFDLTDPDEFLKACHFTNLQPLWAIDNLKKGSKLL